MGGGAEGWYKSTLYSWALLPPNTGSGRVELTHSPSSSETLHTRVQNRLLHSSPHFSTPLHASPHISTPLHTSPHHTDTLRESLICRLSCHRFLISAPPALATVNCETALRKWFSSYLVLWQHHAPPSMTGWKAHLSAKHTITLYYCEGIEREGK